MLKRVHKCHIHTSYKSLQGRWLHLFHGCTNLLLNMLFPISNLNVQLEAISFCPVTCYQRNRPTRHLGYTILSDSSDILDHLPSPTLPFHPTPAPGHADGHLPFTQSYFRDWLINRRMTVHGQSPLMPQNSFSTVIWPTRALRAGRHTERLHKSALDW